MSQKVLVIGGTGMLGKPVALQLKNDGFEVSVFSRNENDARIKMPASFQIEEGDVNNIDSLRNAIKGKDIVHINLLAGPRHKEMEKIELKGTRNIVAVCKEYGVKKLTMISGASVRKENAWFVPTKYKLLAEQSIQQSGLPFIIFRPTWFMETLPKFVRNGKAMLIGNSNKAYRWLSAKDYAQMVSKSMMTNVADNKILTVGGPEMLTMKEAVQKYCSSLDKKIKLSTVPAGFIKFIAILTFNFELKRAVNLLNYFNKVDEDKNYKPTEKLLGKAETTIDEWLKIKA